MGERHVLIVEDDRVTALVLSEYLAAHGYRTTVAANGQDGLSKFVADRPDLVVCDVLLPRMNGFRTAAEMKDTGRTVPIVLMSAFYRTRQQLQDHIPSLDIDAFLPKPFDLDDLLSRVQSLLA